MAEPKWTLGPWMVGESGSEHWPFWSAINSQDNVAAMRITTKENAALIAAAPELYEALEKLINDLPDCTIDWARDGMGNTNANCIVRSRDKGKAALAKARGEGGE